MSRHSKLEPYYGMIRDWLAQENYQATRIYELLIQQGYEGSYETVKRYVRGIKEERDRVAYIRFETVPGLQAQVDFSDFKVVEANGRQTTLYSFMMVFGFPLKYLSPLILTFGNERNINASNHGESCGRRKNSSRD